MASSQTRKIPHPETSPRRLLTLTKQGHRVLLATKRVPKNQAIHHGFAKPREAHHDADLYRMYHTAAGKIERQGGRNLRVILDYELKKRVYHDIAKLGSDRESPTRKKEIAEKHGLQLVRGKIPLPDLRIEYETREGETARVDLELATEHYRGRIWLKKCAQDSRSMPTRRMPLASAACWTSENLLRRFCPYEYAHCSHRRDQGARLHRL